MSALTVEHGGVLEPRPPTSSKELGELKEIPGLLVPDELRAAWRITNGTNHTLFARPRFLTGYAFLSVRDAIKERAGFERRAPRYAGYQESRPRDARISPGWYQPGWLPFATFGGATLVLLVDASPGPGGRVGQVIAFTHDPDEMTYVAPSFSEFLQASLQWLEARPQDLLEE